MSDATRAAYGRWARWYDRLATLPGVRSWRAAAAAELDLDDGDAVVEMGCGTGANLPHLRERVGTAGRVVGLDLTRPMLERARGRGDAHLVQADATRPPMCPSGSSHSPGSSKSSGSVTPSVSSNSPGSSGSSGPVVDGLLGTFVVAMFDDPATVVDEWCDLVRPGGRVALLHFRRSDRSWARPVDAAYDLFVWLASTGRRRPSADAASHDERVAAAHDALAERANEYREHSMAGGYLRLVSGRIE